MAEGMGERSIHGIKEQKERLSDEELGNLLAAIGNHEAKAITLLVMRPGEIYTYRELFKEFLRAQGEVKGWQISPGVPFGYCEDSLSPIGLVAKEALNPDLSTYGYSKTEYGKEIGDPMAGLLLDFSLRHPDLSLIDIFGQAASTAKESIISSGVEFKARAPIARLAIFRALLQAQHLPTTEADLLKINHGTNILTDGQKDNLSEYLAPLSEKGILVFRAHYDIQNPYFYYRPAVLVPENDPPPLTRLVWQTIRDNPEKLWSSGEIAQHLSGQDASTASNKKNVEEIIVPYILAYLCREGYLVSLPQSQITINDTQGGLLSELVTLLDKVQNRDKETLETGRKLADRIRVNPGIVAELLRKAREHSPNAQQQPISESTKNIKIILGRHPNSTLREVTEYLNQDFGKKLKVKSVKEIVRKHLRGEIVYEMSKGGARRFSLAPKVEENTHS